jgi:hypothetical protein
VHYIENYLPDLAPGISWLKLDGTHAGARIKIPDNQSLIIGHAKRAGMAG